MSPEKLWKRTQHALDRGDFTLLDELITAENASILDLLQANGLPLREMQEAFAWACFNGHTGDAESLLDLGVDPAKSDKTGMPGFHSAASRGHVDTVMMLIRRNAPLEQLNTYSGTVLGQTLWSAVNEPREGQAESIELLIDAGAVVESGTSQWWNDQDVRSTETKQRVSAAIERSRSL